MSSSRYISVAVDDDDNQEVPLVPPASSAAAATPAIHKPIRIIANDGVFSNLSAKPSVPSSVQNNTDSVDNDENDPRRPWLAPEPPTYTEVMGDAPAYFEPAVVYDSQYDEDGQVCVDGMPVGHYLIFIVNMITSMAFDFVGFMLTTMLATSHAAKSGSKCGLGLTLIRYGSMIRTQAQDNSTSSYGYVDPDSPDDGSGNDSDSDDGKVFSSIMMIVGVILIVKSNIEFAQARRMRAIIMSQSTVTSV